MSAPAALLLDTQRTVFGKNRGGLSQMRVDDLAALPLRVLAERRPDLPATVDDVVLGNTNGAGEDNRNVARMATLLAEYPVDVPAVTVNRLCGSGGEAVVQAGRAVAAGDLDLVVAGGVEGMSRAPLVLPRAGRALDATQQLVATTVGWRLANPRFPDHWTDSLGACVEGTAAEHGITRAEQDEFALRSHTLADEAWRKGLHRNVTSVGDLDRDESIRPGASAEALASLAPAFVRDGTLTAGNSSPINDGAAAIVIGSARSADRLGYEPLARLVGSSAVGVEPDRFAQAPALAVRRLLDRHNLHVHDVDVWEVNEAFAAVVLSFIRELPGISPEQVNKHGGAIAIGHPLGASMTRVVADAAHQLQDRGGGRAVVTACIGVGQGLALLLDTDFSKQTDR
jgi:acetyl-CoA acyltransferase